MPVQKSPVPDPELLSPYAVPDAGWLPFVLPGLQHRDCNAAVHRQNRFRSMKQRVAIAKGMALGSKIILMDEPFAALDAMTRKQLQSELLKLKQKEKITVIFITHNIQEAISLGNRIMVMSKEGTIKEHLYNTIEKPVTPASEGYAKLWEHLNNQLT